MEDPLVSLAIALIASEEGRGEEVEVGEEKPSTKIVSEEDVSVGGHYVLVRESGGGELKQLMIKTDSGDYRLWVKIDGREVFIKDYDWFRKHSAESSLWYAGESEEGYVLVLTGIRFREGLEVMLEAKGKLKIVEYVAFLDKY